MNKHFSSANKPTSAHPAGAVQLKTVAVPNRLAGGANVQQKPQANAVQLKSVAVPNRLGTNANVQQKPQAPPIPPKPAPVQNRLLTPATSASAQRKPSPAPKPQAFPSKPAPVQHGAQKPGQNRLQTPPSAAVSVQRKPAPVVMRGSGTVMQGRFIGGRPSATVQKKATQSAGGHAFQLDTPPSGAGGQPLPKEVQAKMEEFFGTNFSDVRVHVGPEASAIGALAFTHGSHLYFAPGQYNPRSPQGLQLLGHEMTHVVQQRAGRVRNPFGSGVAVVQDHGLEAEADRMGLKLAQAFR